MNSLEMGRRRRIKRKTGRDRLTGKEISSYSVSSPVGLQFLGDSKLQGLSLLELAQRELGLSEDRGIERQNKGIYLFDANQGDSNPPRPSHSSLKILTH